MVSICLSLRLLIVCVIWSLRGSSLYVHVFVQHERRLHIKTHIVSRWCFFVAYFRFNLSLAACTMGNLPRVHTNVIIFFKEGYPRLKDIPFEFIDYFSSTFLGCCVGCWLLANWVQCLPLFYNFHSSIFFNLTLDCKNHSMNLPMLIGFCIQGWCSERTVYNHLFCTFLGFGWR